MPATEMAARFKLVLGGDVHFYGQVTGRGNEEPALQSMK